MYLINARSLSAERLRLDWGRYALDTLLALIGTTGITSIIYLYHLYPRIPNISIVYLLVVLPLATTRGRYSAMLTGVLAFLAFDFFLVPPLYLFTINRPEEWIALSIFLIDALLTGQLAASLRQRAEVATRSEREARALYHLVHVANMVEDAQGQLRMICRAVVETFAAWGVKNCSLIEKDAAGHLQLRACASSEQQEAAREQNQRPGVLADACTKAEKAPEESQPTQQLIHLNRRNGPEALLRLDITGNTGSLVLEERGQEQRGGRSFFWTFIEQVTALIERVQLQQENLHLSVLKRTDALRSALLSSVSHDLRTPLTAIKAAASSLLQEDVEWSIEERRSFLQAIEREADRLNRLVANLLDMSRIEEGALKPDRDIYALRALLQDVVGRMTGLLEGRCIEMDLPADDDLLMVEVDYLHIDQVLTNLLENALRYTPPGSPITIRARQEEKRIVFSVADRGPGIPAAHLEHVFDKFYRVLHGPVTGNSSKGSGLGLAVCKGLIEAHEGTIHAEPRPGGGLIVTVSLPALELERIVE